jgi:hypothetical protein
MVSKNRSTTKGSFGSKLLRYTFWSFYFFFCIFFLLIKKVQLFKVPFRGTWLRRENLEMQTYSSHGNRFYMYLMSISTLLYVKNCYSDYLDLHPNGQKIRFLFARFFWLVEEIENWNVMRADKVIQPFCQSSHCDYE